MGNGTPSPGWYQDPRDASQVRWWDGGQWTHNTQQMPGFASPMSQSPTAPEQAPTPGFEQSVAGDPWAAAGQAPAQPEQPWGQAPGQPEQPQWGQAPAQPEQPQWGQTPEQPWGQAPAQPEQPQWGQASGQPEQPQWGQAPAQPEQPQWGQAPAQPEQPQWGQAPGQPEQPQWGQAPAQPEQPQWGQAPAQPEQPQWGQAPGQPEQPQWGQAPAQPEQPVEGGWQQPAPGAWGSAVPPGPVPPGLAPGSPMGQTNVFPTAETVDPITGMPVSTPDSGSKTSGKRLAAVVLATLLIGVLILGLLWFFLFRPSSDGATGSTGPVEVTATFTGTVDPACADLGAALTADDLSTTVVSRLNDVAIAKDLEENKAYFEQLAKDIAPLMDQYQSACVAAVSAGNAPEFYRTFVDTFEASVTDGATVATTALDSGGQVPPEDADRLRAEASKLEASSAAVISTSGITEEPSPEVSASPEVSGSATAPETDSVVPSPIG
ncbi:MAG: hypothetical protein H6524_04835 [Actinobacteria bacterium]|nr:hypothetical protein [Actinomycetota bacterium]